MKILQLTYRVPFPPNDGGAIGMYNILVGYAQAGHEVHLLTINTPKHFQEEGVLSHFCIQQNVFVNTNLNPIKILLNLFKSTPYNVERFVDEEYKKQLIIQLQQTTFDAIHVDGIFMASYIDVIKQYAQRVPIIVRAHNLECVIWERLAEGETNVLRKWYFQLIAKRLKKYEALYYQKFDSVVAITPEDAARIHDIGVEKHKINVVPAGVLLDKFDAKQEVETQGNTIFSISALDWMPNTEALDWFLANVWPLLKNELPELQFHIAGKAMPKKYFDIDDAHIHTHGMVPDANTFINQYNILVVPLLSGSGMRIKIIEAMAMGKCIISSPIGAEGIAYTNHENILICHTPEEWVENIKKCVEDTAFKNNIARNAKLLALKYYDNRIVTAQYEHIFNQFK